MEKMEVEILKYLYYKGEESKEFQGYKQGKFSALPFEVEKMIVSLDSDLAEIDKACRSLISNYFVVCDGNIIAITEIGFAHYIDEYFDGPCRNCH